MVTQDLQGSLDQLVVEEEGAKRVPLADLAVWGHKDYLDLRVSLVPLDLQVPPDLPVKVYR